MLLEFLCAVSFCWPGVVCNTSVKYSALQWETVAPSPTGSEHQSGWLSSKFLFLEYSLLVLEVVTATYICFFCILQILFTILIGKFPLMN